MEIQEKIAKGKQIAEEEKAAKYAKTEFGYQQIQPFQKMRTDEEKAKDKSIVMTIRLNKEEIKILELAKKAIEQPKDSTAIKTLFKIGAYDVIHDKKTNYIIGTLFKNKRNNYRTGVAEFE